MFGVKWNSNFDFEGDSRGKSKYVICTKFIKKSHMGSLLLNKNFLKVFARLNRQF